MISWLWFLSTFLYDNHFTFTVCIIQKGSQKLCSFGFGLIHLALSWDALTRITWWGIERWKVLVLLNALESWPDFFYLKWADQRTTDGLLTECGSFSALLGKCQVSRVVDLHLHTNRPWFWSCVNLWMMCKRFILLPYVESIPQFYSVSNLEVHLLCQKWNNIHCELLIIIITSTHYTTVLTFCGKTNHCTHRLCWLHNYLPHNSTLYS